jgi:hypothetical protein
MVGIIQKRMKYKSVLILTRVFTFARLIFPENVIIL